MLDGQGCLLPVRHFHREESSHMLSSCSGLRNTCRAESSAESNPNPSVYFRSDIIYPSPLDESESSCGDLDNPYSSKSSDRRGLSSSATKEAATQTRYGYGDLTENIIIPTISSEFDRTSSSHKNCLLPAEEVETWGSSSGELDEVDLNHDMGRSVHREGTYGHFESEIRLDVVERTYSTGKVDIVVNCGEDGSTGKVKGSRKWKNEGVSEDQEFSVLDAGLSPGLGLKTVSVKESRESQDSPVQSGCTEEEVEETALDIVLTHVTCKTRCKRSRMSPSQVAYRDSKMPGDSHDGNTEYQQPYLPGLDDESALRCLAFVPLYELGRLAMLGRRYRDLVRSRFIFQLRRVYGMVEHLVFLYTSLSGVWTVYDAKRNAWRILPPANVSPLFLSSDKESLSAGTHVLWLGKEIFDFVYYRYDLLSNSWERGPAMVNPRCLFASASCGEFAYVAGGFGPANDMGALCLLNSAERYNSLTGEWELLQPMSTPRHKCAGFFMDGKFYVIGGRDANHHPIMSGEEYNPITGSWRSIPDMYFAPEVTRQDMMEPSPPLVAVVNNQLYAVENTTNTLKVYNKQNNTWSNLGLLPVRADLLNGWGVAFKALGDRLFVMGESEGIAVCCWRPGPNARASDWDHLEETERGADCFLYNCAVMAC